MSSQFVLTGPDSPMPNQLPIPTATEPKKKIAILGTTPSRGLAPINDPEWEIWTIGPGGKNMHRWDRLYETHQTWPEDFKEYLNELSNEKSPKIVRTVTPLRERLEGHWLKRIGKDREWYDKTITGNFEAVSVIDREELFSRHKRMWFSTSICYAIVDAIERDPLPEVIGCFGIDLESDEEHISQHMGCCHFLDIARLMGVQVVMPAGCGLEKDLNPYPDRYETHLALTYQKKREWIGEMEKRADQQQDAIKMQVHRLEGAIFKMRQFHAEISALKDPEEIKKYIDEIPSKIQVGEKEHSEALNAFMSTFASLHHMKGEKAAVEYFERMYVWGMKDPT